MKRSRFAPAVAAAMLMLLSACMVVGPDYVRPTVITPDAYKEIDGWRVAQPKDDLIRGAWWEIFGDPQLNALAAQVSVSNQNLAVAEAQFRQARALVQEARASYFPTATIGIGANRSSAVDYHRGRSSAAEDCRFRLIPWLSMYLGSSTSGVESAARWSPTRPAPRRARAIWRTRVSASRRRWRRTTS